MFGREVGSLKIMRISKSLTDDKIPAFEDFKRTAKVEWEKSGDQGNRWVKVVQELLADSSVKRLSVHWVSLYKHDLTAKNPSYAYVDYEKRKE